MATIEEQVAYEIALEEYGERAKSWKPSLGIPIPQKPRRPVGRPRLQEPKKKVAKKMSFKILIELDAAIITALEEVRGDLSFGEALCEALRSALSLPLKFS